MAIFTESTAIEHLPAKHHLALIKALSEAIDSEIGGEVVVRLNQDSAKIFVTQGKIAWITASSYSETFMADLSKQKLVDPQSLQEVYQECRRTGQNFGETLISWKLLSHEKLRNALLQHIATVLMEILSWPDLATMFVPHNRTYSSDLTFSLTELLHSVINLDRVKGMSPPQNTVSSDSIVSLKDYYNKRATSNPTQHQESMNMHKLVDEIKTYPGLISFSIVQTEPGQALLDWNDPEKTLSTVEVIDLIQSTSQLGKSLQANGKRSLVHIQTDQAHVVITHLDNMDAKLVVLFSSESNLPLIKQNLKRISEQAC
jgi:hypothetical protein